MTSGNLAKIEKVNLRDAWPDEARNFTPWLAENIVELGDTLGIELELQEQESPVGSCSLDIFATDASDDRPVIIENQLNATDNDHLSRLLIYAAGKDAKLVIWVASYIDDEHRQVLDWLNQRTDEFTQFFGVVVELWKIDNSRAAPHFSVVTAPNEWRKQNVTNLRTNTAKRRRQDRSFRQGLEERLKRGHNYLVPESTNRPNPWCVLENLVIGNGIGHYSTDFKNNVGVNLVIGDREGTTPERNLRYLELLKLHQPDIESALCNAEAEEWTKWLYPGSRERSFITVYRPGNIYDDPIAWDEYHDWIIDKFFKFRNTFSPLLEEIIQAET